MAVHTDSNGNQCSTQVDKQGNCSDCGADNLNPDTGKYGK